MTIEEAQQLVEVWKLKQQQTGTACSSSAKTCCETEEKTQQSGVKDAAEALPAALTETLRHLNTEKQ